MRTITIPVIENAESHAAALERILVLWGSPEGSDERAELDTLATLVAAYENAVDPWPDLSPREIVLGVLESHDLKQQDLVPVFGSKQQVSDFLAGRRQMSVIQALRMKERYHVPLDLLLVREGAAAA